MTTPTAESVKAFLASAAEQVDWARRHTDGYAETDIGPDGPAVAIFTVLGRDAERAGIDIDALCRSLRNGAAIA